MVRVPGVTKGATVAGGITDRSLHRLSTANSRPGTPCL